MKFYSVITFILGGVFLVAHLKRQNEIDLLARTMWGEARGEGTQGMLAVGNVIKNRADQQKWYGKSIVDVITKDFQFSAWNLNDPNREEMLNVKKEDDADFRQALLSAKDIVTGNAPDITSGADHYHAKNIRPNWINKMKITAIIGNHIFYRSLV